MERLLSITLLQEVVDLPKPAKPLCEIAIDEGTIPHTIKGHFGAGKVTLVPAGPGTGVIAGAAVRAVVECAGIKNILSKVYGSANSLNVVKATMAALKMLRSHEEVVGLRGVEIPQ